MAIITQKIYESEEAEYFVLRSSLNDQDVAVVTQLRNGCLALTCCCRSRYCSTVEGAEEKVFATLQGVRMRDDYFQPVPGGELAEYVGRRRTANHVQEEIGRSEEKLAHDLGLKPGDPAVRALLEERLR